MKRVLSVLLASVLAFLCLAACSGEGTPSGDAKEDSPLHVKYADAGWDSIRMHNAIAMFIGEQAYNIEPEQVSGTTPITYSALKTGDIQVLMETWADNLPTYDEDIASGEIVELGVNFDDNAQGFYVPRYVIEGDSERGIEAVAPDLKTVKDLLNYSDVFEDPEDPSKGRLYGSISGWAIDEIMRNKYFAYGLDACYNYADPGSDPALSAAISSAYEKGEPIVAYYWEPTWISGKYDLVLLDDEPYEDGAYQEGKTACPSMDITICVYKDLVDQAPEYCDYLRKYKSSSELTAEGLAYMQDTKASIEDTAIWYLKQNDELLDEWLPEDKAALVREALK